MMQGRAPTFSWRHCTPAVAAAVALMLGACASTRPVAAAGAWRPVQTAASSQLPTGAGATRYRIGAPYEANGLWFVPAEQPTYQDVGVAGVYTPATSTTADGERFDAGLFSAAHATLPMPSIVEVTNMETGRRIEVRVNDRGATRRGQVIELSRAAADALGFGSKSSAKVQVRFVRPGPLDTTYAAAPAPAPVQAPVQAAPAPPPRVTVAAREIAPVNGGFAVQAGAFADRANAERLMAQLGAAGQTSIHPMERNGATLYRVWVGPWANEAAASAAREQVASLGYGEARIVQAF